MRPALALVIVMVLTGCSGVIPGLDGSSGGLGKLVREDVLRGREMALAAKDQAAVDCSDAILAVLGPEDVATLAPIGVYSTFIAARELRRHVGTGIDENVHNKCAPLIIDAQLTLARLGLVAVPGGGAAGLLLRR